MRIGIDLGGTKIEGIALDDGGAVLARRRMPSPPEGYEAVLDALVDLIDHLEGECGARGTIGVGTPGALSPASGLIKNANSTHLIGHPLNEDLAQRLGRPVRIANDANCFALSEAVDGAGRGEPVVFGVIVGTGVGGGIVVHQRILGGPNAIAGEWGHNPLPWPTDDERPGPDCYCGRTGCIEAFLSGPALASDYELGEGCHAVPEEIVELAANEDAGAQACLQRYEQRMARALAHVINILDPNVIVLGGGLSRIERLYQNVPRHWEGFVFSDHVDTRLVPPVHGDASGVRGAAWLWPR